MKTKLLENIEIVTTGQREVIKTPLSDIRSELSSLDQVMFISGNSLGYIYSVEVRFGYNQVISQQALDAGGDETLHRIKKQVGRAIAEEVYGDMRKELFMLALDLEASGTYYNNPAVDRVEKLIKMISYE